MSSRAASVAESSQSADNPCAPLRLLVVDDDATQRDLIARGAKQAGHDVTFATSVLEAVAALHGDEFDCVTLDLMLEDGDGTEVLSAMAHAMFTGSVILISGMNADQRTAARAHARLHGIELRSLPKPLDLSALRVCLADLAKLAKGLPAAHMWGGIQVGREQELHRKRRGHEPRRKMSVATRGDQGRSVPPKKGEACDNPPHAIFATKTGVGA
ncbi:MAG: response regulator [Xanthobacteraceae bacterium]|nr:response regulator [Bradyrhizobium sp.]